jgi:hypothetical protein
MVGIFHQNMAIVLCWGVQHMTLQIKLDEKKSKHA